MKKLIPLFLTVIFLVGCAANIQQPLSKQHQTLEYQCGAVPLIVTTDNVNKSVTLIIESQLRTLKQVKVAAGAKYEAGKYGFWTVEDEAVIFKNNLPLVDNCRLPKVES